MTRRLTTSGLAAAFALALVVAPASPQSNLPVTVTSSSDAIETGTVLELRVDLPVPAGRIVYFPDTLPATVNLESAAPVVSRHEPTPDGGARLTLTYPLMAFGVGTLPVPGFDVLMAPRRGDEAGGVELPGGSLIGAWGDAPRTPGAAAVTRIPRQAVWVEPVFTPADFMEGIEPMPANDVAGGSWSWPSLALALFCSSVLAVTLVSTTGSWLRARASGERSVSLTPEARRELALRQLDDLLTEGLHTDGRMLDFYARSSGIVRSYVEAMDGAWAPSLTSHELMTRLRSRSGDEAAADLPGEMGTAEVVKFGRLRPDRSAAERHWRALKHWVEASGGRAW